MRKLFHRWLLISVLVAFVLAFSMTFFMKTSVAHSSAAELLQLKLEEAYVLMERRQHSLEVIHELNRDLALSKVRLLRKIIKERPEILHDDKAFEGLLGYLDVDEIHVSNEKGILFVTAIQRPDGICRKTGYDLATDEQSRAFLPGLKDKNFELVQELMENGAEGKVMQYAGIAREDKPGIIEIGLFADRLEGMERLVSLADVESAISIGKCGGLRIEVLEDAKKALMHHGQFWEKIDDVTYLSMERKCMGYRLVASLPKSEVLSERNTSLIAVVVGELVVCGIVFLLISLMLERTVVAGVNSVNKSLTLIEQGNLEEKVDVQEPVEFAVLSRVINKTVDALKEAIAEASRRLDSELEAGKVIQTAALPLTFPNEPGNRVFASMLAAREVGGDFYDVFTLDDGREVLLIADVSGKGLTAALCMMTSKTLLKSLMERGMSPVEAVHYANLDMCQQNAANMFVTVFLGVYDKESHELSCINAGHNPPVLCRAGRDWEYLKIRHSVALGASERAKYVVVTIPFREGDRLFLYTDGVTEAQNSENKLFGEDRLLQKLNENKDVASPRELIEDIKATLAEHSRDVPQSDDITMLALFA